MQVHVYNNNAKMDQNQHVQPAQEAHGENQYQSNPVTTPTVLPTQTSDSSLSSSYPRQHPNDPQLEAMYELRQERLQQQLNNFWAKQCQEIQEATDLRTHSLPLARIKKIMKSDEDVKLVSAEAPVVFAKACEMFIMELTLRAWANVEEDQRKIIKKHDIASSISRADVFDFLIDTVPRPLENILDQQGFVGLPTSTVPTPLNDACYHNPPPQALVPGNPYGSPRIAVGMPILDQNHPGLQIHHFLTPMEPTPTPTPNPQNPSPSSDC